MFVSSGFVVNGMSALAFLPASPMPGNLRITQPFGELHEEAIVNETIHLWDRALLIELNDEQLSVLGPAEARNILLLDWPVERTDMHKKASEACLAAMMGADPEIAWLAFMEAAIEAGIFVR